MTQVRRILGASEIMRIRKAGFVVTTYGMPDAVDTITYPAGGKASAKLARLLPGGRADVNRLRRLGIWTSP
jgi:hypothetical protein